MIESCGRPSSFRGVWGVPRWHQSSTHLGLSLLQDRQQAGPASVDPMDDRRHRRTNCGERHVDPCPLEQTQVGGLAHARDDLGHPELPAEQAGQ